MKKIGDRTIIWFLIVVGIIGYMYSYSIRNSPTRKITIIALESKNIMGYTRLYFYEAKLVSLNGKLVYIPTSKQRFIVFEGDYSFISEQAYTVQYVDGSNYLLNASPEGETT